MKIAIYGMPSSGKTTLISKMTNVKVLNGRQELDRLSDGRFSQMSEEEKNVVRIRYTEYLSSMDEGILVSDGHYSFVDKVVFTPSDGDVYDVIFYLYCVPEELKRRFALSDKNAKYANMSLEAIGQWQDFEIESLRQECHERNKDFYVISDNGEATEFFEFFQEVTSGLSAVQRAKEIAKQISREYPLEKGNYLCVVDGDKTITRQDSFRYCYNGNTNVFDGNFYTSYQSYLFMKEVETIDSLPESVNDIALNRELWNRISGKSYVILSSGITMVWEKIKEIHKLDCVIAEPMISADTKYFVVKFLRDMGYFVMAFGDGKNDFYMLKEANQGYLWIGERLSRSLANTDLTGIKLIYDKKPYFLADEGGEDDQRDISVCKSNSGINGNRLAMAHMRLGMRLGSKMATLFPAKNTAILVLDRGGRFFGDGVYLSFGGMFYVHNPAYEAFPQIEQERVIIVDSVINTGKSIKKIAAHLKGTNPNREIVLATNVIQQSALDVFSDYKVFAVRASSNSYVGKRQAVQKGNTGPDTADRLFNIICRSF